MEDAPHCAPSKLVSIAVPKLDAQIAHEILQPGGGRHALGRRPERLMAASGRKNVPMLMPINSRVSATDQ